MQGTLKDLIREAWRRGKESGMSDQEIIAEIENEIKQRQTNGQVATDTRRKKKYNYTPMTEEEIEAAQREIGITDAGEERVERVVYTSPQVLYGPPPVKEETTVVYQSPQVLYGPPPVKEETVVYQPPQVLYGPPPRDELESMFVEEDTPKTTPHQK